ncbi:MAG TPA: hypothetical protein VFQ40_04230 [Actinomycetota bacterium]|nr:hypothetical protein [Actinomycetota bacterium]
MWIVFVTDGVVIEYAPEAYPTRDLAVDEARRWAWILSGMGWLPIEEPFPDRWSVGDRDVRLVPVTGEGMWVGTFWTWDGYPDPEAILFRGRDEARAWATSSLGDLKPSPMSENDWSVVATFERHGEEAYAVVNRLKRLVAQ